MNELMQAHTTMWERMEHLLIKQSLPQALLFVGPRHAALLPFAHRIMAAVLCESEPQPCGLCSACHWVLDETHPDIHYIRQQNGVGAIKIDQVRELQQLIYQTPQRGKRRFVVIDPADRMNVASANALLKMLEEPPLHIHFILIAEQIGSLPATILSRCQKYVFQAPIQDTNELPCDYLGITQFYSKDSPRATLLADRESIVALLAQLREGMLSPCTVAAQWSVYAFEDLLWLLYLITAQWIHEYLVNVRGALPSSAGVIQLFKQLDKMNAIMRKLNHSLNMNQTLVLEDLLLGYIE